jgi:uncharacterized protein
VFDTFRTLTHLVPALAKLDRAGALPTGLPAPTHPGAERYFQESGLL